MTVIASDAVALLPLLVKPLAKLCLRLHSEFRPIFYAIARHQPVIRILDVGYIFGHCVVSAADVLPLNRLSALEKLVLKGLMFNLNVDDWRDVLSGLPNLLDLDITIAKKVPPKTFIVIGQCCRRLQRMSLDAKCQPSDLCCTVYDLPLFPKLHRFLLGCRPLLDGLE